MSSFSMTPRLEGDSLAIADLPLCALRLMKDANYPWVMMVPKRNDMIEITDLSEPDRQQLIREICQVSDALKAVTTCDKLNVGALGNMVPQLHVHVIARFQKDPAWPGPVWGAVPAKPYTDEDADRLIGRLREALAIT
ncbi:HIT domain-containing protein [Roseibium limicola]|uniref:HIT family protein n=1 Tax=Roseibium limicola TaxID=2816037 RepID=A0A939EQE8_9HYPH|nr:HIT family protein [Roseibium limicola]MBO0346440.1 HIT family protein [Roseibium limicola]